ncbi:hypothetical protein NE865_11741 [Phthorimaea operculella]|nr:hypothetical protein NE865_11741 [Phthorimaea operculella]
MEELLATQADITERIGDLFNSFKRENIQRRKAIAAKKLEELKKLFDDFHANDLILQQYEDKTDEYFTDEYYESTKTFYTEVSTYIKNYIMGNKGKSEQGKKTGEQTKNDRDQQKQEEDEDVRKMEMINKLDEKFRKQAANYKAFDRTVRNINIETLKEKWEYEDTLKTLESRWKTIDNMHWEIESDLVDGREKLPTMKQQSVQQIKRMHDVTQESLNAIKNLGVDIDTWDPLIVHILDQKLDTDTHTEYIDSLKDRRELPNLKEFLEFIEESLHHWKQLAVNLKTYNKNTLYMNIRIKRNKVRRRGNFHFKRAIIITKQVNQLRNQHFTRLQ